LVGRPTIAWRLISLSGEAIFFVEAESFTTTADLLGHIFAGEAVLLAVAAVSFAGRLYACCRSCEGLSHFVEESHFTGRGQSDPCIT
jgi:hypothetical protein